ncbi:MAG: glycerate kinase [Phycisphaeraceae bacterium]|nr:glycerate kinase [Phycisphaeraceae bacterium]
MRILCCPDSFKESISAPDAAAAMARGARAAGAEADVCPIGDGGEGTVEAMITASGGQRRVSRVTGPLGQPIDAAWGLLGDGQTAVIEMAAASGLALVQLDQRDPTRTTTFGTGELIRAALDVGVNRIILGIGGSATTDGGCGAAQALGVRFVGTTGLMCGGLMQQVQSIDLSELDPRLKQVQLVVACDVTNPLAGPNGAAYVYGPQKGASPDMVQQLDAGLRHLAELAPAMDEQPGSGAAGGLGGGAVAFLGAKLQSGIELVLDALHFDQRLTGCDLCLTGEGKMDGQTLSGKAIMGVVNRCNRANVPVIALVGCVGKDVDRMLDAGLVAYHVIAPPDVSAQESMRRAGEFLEHCAREVVEKQLN